MDITLLAQQAVFPTTKQHVYRNHPLPATHDLFFPGRQGSRAWVGRPKWSVVAFRLPRRHGNTHAGAQYDALYGLQT
jgi:hypothetical protein